MSMSMQDPIERLVRAATSQPKTDASSITSNELEQKLNEHESRRQSAQLDGQATPASAPAREGASAEKAADVSRGPVTPRQRPQSPTSYPPSPSPALLSPASSLIFERNVQDPSAIPSTTDSNSNSAHQQQQQEQSGPTSPRTTHAAIPSHLQTDDQIPAVLEASSIALTRPDLDLADVEILTHPAHTLAGTTTATSGSARTSALPSPAASSAALRAASPPALPPHEHSQQQYASGSPPDPRRLSFISFADVVQGEQAESTSPRPGSASARPAAAAAALSSGAALVGGSGVGGARSPGLSTSPTVAGLGLSVELVSERMSDAIRAVENA